ncbi:hypothetical protein COV23_00070 [Candidatus Wolfebacteria bacterium CG10_big_fil_rev_8_21_14_0_10_31_9]|uniref:Uncharacterized protein n=1 Tax=Candidatus Wolfebacteria bacterium CG10_big_fil_rev_8_21_14_0_10_31_9 TaxID=1975070 RepID=A0A2H0RD44_9BACT|nr:MAG: hypothetical protein COV23_00070 [Candidatus Wolfebacteria bacterium CG10_big_fil_rev_8_21_14_0_10_31_9]
MSKKIKTIISIIIMAVAIIGAFFIMRNSFPSVSVEENKKEWFKSSGPDLNELNSSGIFQKVGEFGIGNNSLAQKNNLTESISGSLFNQLGSVDTLNQIKSNPKGSIELMSGKISDDVMFKMQTDLNFITTIDDSVLKISNNTSVSAKKEYLNNITNVINNDFAGFNKMYLEIIIDTYQKLDSSSAIQASNIYRKLSQDFINTSVPKDWVDIHKEMIINYKNSEIIYSAMANYQNDPIKGYMVLEAIQSLVNKSKQIQDELIKKVKNI